MLRKHSDTDPDSFRIIYLSNFTLPFWHKALKAKIKPTPPSHIAVSGKGLHTQDLNQINNEIRSKVLRVKKKKALENSTVFSNVKM